MHTEGPLSPWLNPYLHQQPTMVAILWVPLGTIQISLHLVQKLKTLREKEALNVVWGLHI